MKSVPYPHRWDKNTLDKNRLGTPEDLMYNLAGRTQKIVGQTYRAQNVQWAFEEKNRGTKLLLIRESDNPHDRYAIGVYAALSLQTQEYGYEWHKVGHIAAEEARSAELSSITTNRVVEAKKYTNTSLVLTSTTRSYS